MLPNVGQLSCLCNDVIGYMHLRQRSAEHALEEFDQLGKDVSRIRPCALPIKNPQGYAWRVFLDGLARRADRSSRSEADTAGKGSSDTRPLPLAPLTQVCCSHLNAA